MPLGPTDLSEELVLVTKSETGTMTRCKLGLATFVPMTGLVESAPLEVNPGALTDMTNCYEIAVT